MRNRGALRGKKRTPFRLTSSDGGKGARLRAKRGMGVFVTTRTMLPNGKCCLLRKTMCAFSAMMLHKVQIAGRDAATKRGHSLRLIVAKRERGTRWKTQKRTQACFIAAFKGLAAHFPLYSLRPAELSSPYHYVTHLLSRCTSVNSFLPLAERHPFKKRLGVWGRDALRKHHSAVFLAKAREELAPSGCRTSFDE